MEFFGRGGISGVFQDFVEDVDGSVNQWLNQFVDDGVGPVFDVSSQNGSVDGFDGVLAWGEHGKDGEVSLESKIDDKGSGLGIQRS